MHCAVRTMNSVKIKVHESELTSVLVKLGA